MGSPQGTHMTFSLNWDFTFLKENHFLISAKLPEVCLFPFDLHWLAFFLFAVGLKGAQGSCKESYSVSSALLLPLWRTYGELISSAVLLREAGRDFWVLHMIFLILTASVVWHLKWKKNVLMQNVSCTIQQWAALSTWNRTHFPSGFCIISSAILRPLTATATALTAFFFFALTLKPVS